MILPDGSRGIFTQQDRERFHQQLTNMLSEIEAGKEHIKNPTEIDIEIHLYYGRHGTIVASEGRAFSRFTIPQDGYVWDWGDEI